MESSACVCVCVFLCKYGNVMSLLEVICLSTHYVLYIITFWKFPECECSQVIISKKMGMVARLNSSSGIKVISRMGPTMPGMKQILWLPERYKHTYGIKKKRQARSDSFDPRSPPVLTFALRSASQVSDHQNIPIQEVFSFAKKTLNSASYLRVQSNAVNHIHWVICETLRVLVTTLNGKQIPVTLICVVRRSASEKICYEGKHTWLHILKGLHLLPSLYQMSRIAKPMSLLISPYLKQRSNRESDRKRKQPLSLETMLWSIQLFSLSEAEQRGGKDNVVLIYPRMN